LPVLDAPCGFGRNSLYLAALGYRVTGADLDRTRVRFLALRREDAATRVGAVVCDLNAEQLPFARGSFGALLVVHFIPEQWGNYFDLLRPGGVLLFETMGGQGRNYLQLPKAGQIQSLLRSRFVAEIYHERHVGPPGVDAVSVKVVARKV
jgi:SAM-dependent methyltransferase